MTRYIFTLFVMCLLIPSISLGKSPSSDSSTLIRYYEELRADWGKIFPNKNRNAGGALFFKYILDQNLEYEEFMQFNKLYCAVSGSLIPPDAQPDEIFLTNSENDEKICGQYYKCCWPCLCDVMKYSETKKISINFKDQSKDIYAVSYTHLTLPTSDLV